MPSVAYEIHHDENEAEDLGRPSATQSMYEEMRARGKHFPTTVGVTEICMGFLITVLGATEVFIVPMYESTDGYNLIEFKKQNCYGVGMVAGIILVLTGSTALRASISKRNTTVYRFYNLTILSIIVYTALSITLMVGYTEGWTAQDSYKSDTLRQVHNFVTIMNFLSLLFVISTFLQYSPLICCGEFPLWALWAKCFCICCFRQVNRRFFKVVLPAGDYCCLCLDGVSKPASEVGEQQRNTVSPQSNVSRYDGQIDFVQSMDFMRSDQYYGGNPISPERHLTSEDYDGDADVTCDVTRATPPGVVTAREANGKLLRSIQRSI